MQLKTYMSTDIKLSKAQIFKIIQSGRFLGKFLGPLFKAGLPLIKNVIKPLAKSVLISLGLTAAASAAGAGIQKNTWFWNSNFAQALEDSNILLKGVTKTIKNERKNKKEPF